MWRNYSFPRVYKETVFITPDYIISSSSALQALFKYSSLKPYTMSSIVDKVFHRKSTDSKDASHTSTGSTDYSKASVNSRSSKSSDLKNSSISSKDLPTSPATKTAGIPSSPAPVGHSTDVTRSDGTHRHTQGHSHKDTVTDLSSADPANVTQEVQHLAHVTKETRHQHEIEEVERDTTLHSHHHHVQHHVQPIKHEEHAPEQVQVRAHPETQIHEKHSSTTADATLLDSVTGGLKDTVSHAGLDRKVVDKGETVKEIEHHHVKNIITPVIHQDTHGYTRIQTVIPTTHTIHHAPIVHESTEHTPISKEEFLKGGGILGSELKTAREVGVLHDGKCERQVDGVAEKLEKELGLSPGKARSEAV